MEAQERLDKVAGQLADEDVKYLAANVLGGDRQDATDKLGRLGEIAEAAQKTADDMTRVCDGPVVTAGTGRQGAVVALACGSDIVNQPGSISQEEVYVIRE